MHGTTPCVRTLLEDPTGVIRDPDVSYDGRRMLFAWKKSDRLDDFHLYEMDLPPASVRQLTFGLGFADYEGAYLPDGDISSTRRAACRPSIVSRPRSATFYTCDSDGRYLRRLGFDQVHTNYPTVTEDGRVLYTRWEYNDRGQIFPQGLFQMNPDGTGQTAFYGNNSWFPTTILHARQHPRHAKGAGHRHRAPQPAGGKTDRARSGPGTAGKPGGPTGRRRFAPTPAVHVDAYGQDGDLFQYPYPLSETEYLVAYDRWAGAAPSDRHRLEPPSAVRHLLHDHRRPSRAAGQRPADLLQPAGPAATTEPAAHGPTGR